MSHGPICFCKAHIPNIHALNSDTHTLRIQYEYTVYSKTMMGVAIEGMDIWYMAHIIWALEKNVGLFHTVRIILYLSC